MFLTNFNQNTFTLNWCSIKIMFLYETRLVSEYAATLSCC